MNASEELNRGPGDKESGGELLEGVDCDQVTRVAVLHKNVKNFCRGSFPGVKGALTTGRKEAQEEKKKKITEKFLQRFLSRGQKSAEKLQQAETKKHNKQRKRRSSTESW